MNPKDPMSKSSIDPRIIEYLYGDLEGTRLLALQREIESDPVLAQQLRETRQVLGLVDAVQDPDPAPELVTSVQMEARRVAHERKRGAATSSNQLVVALRRLLWRPELGIGIAAVLVVAVGLYMTREAKQPDYHPNDTQRLKEEIRLPKEQNMEAPSLPNSSVGEDGELEETERESKLAAPTGTSETAAKAEEAPMVATEKSDVPEAIAESPDDGKTHLSDSPVDSRLDAGATKENGPVGQVPKIPDAGGRIESSPYKGMDNLNSELTVISGDKEAAAEDSGEGLNAAAGIGGGSRERSLSDEDSSVALGGSPSSREGPKAAKERDLTGTDRTVVAPREGQCLSPLKSKPARYARRSKRGAGSYRKSPEYAEKMKKGAFRTSADEPTPIAANQTKPTSPKERLSEKQKDGVDGARLPGPTESQTTPDSLVATPAVETHTKQRVQVTGEAESTPAGGDLPPSPSALPAVTDSEPTTAGALETVKVAAYDDEEEVAAEELSQAPEMADSQESPLLDKKAEQKTPTKKADNASCADRWKLVQDLISGKKWSLAMQQLELFEASPCRSSISPRVLKVARAGVLDGLGKKLEAQAVLDSIQSDEAVPAKAEKAATEIAP